MTIKCGKVPPFRDTTNVVTTIRLELGPQGRRCFSHIEAVLLCFTPNGLGGSLSGPIFFFTLCRNRRVSAINILTVRLHCMCRSIRRQCTRKMIFNLHICRRIFCAKLYADSSCSITLSAARRYPHHSAGNRYLV